MPTSNIFPSFLGMTYNVSRSPAWTNATSKSVTGKRVAIQRSSRPIWNFTLDFDFLSQKQMIANVSYLSDPNSLIQVSPMVVDDVAALKGFYNNHAADYSTFLFDDYDDDSIAQQQIAIGDGVTTNIQVVRPQGVYNEPIQNINGTPVLAAIWQPGTAVSLNALVIPTQSGMLTQRGRVTVGYQSVGWPVYYKCTTAGTTNGTEPRWRQLAPLPPQTITDGSVTWTAVGTPFIPYIERPADSYGGGATAVGKAVIPGGGNAGGFTFVCTTAGSSSGGIGAWPQSLGATVSDGATWTNMGVSAVGSVPNPLLPVAPALYVLSPLGLISFTTAPPNLDPIFLTSSFWFLCAFKPGVEFKQFMAQFTELQKLEFESVIQ